MDANSVVSMISNLGFPITVNIVLLYILYQIVIKFENEFNDMRTSIQLNTKELSELRNALKNMGESEKKTSIQLDTKELSELRNALKNIGVKDNEKV